ncbi:MAG TPA: GNAT family N-acetyltransferase [Dokdonella sp.]|uniref:GNAT family N-acetyltransferase n=1 Tax=Dokdonella sp. TaxID=2291710 RepID=UPI002CC09408|nr:GNAT family N-acetyltransferase [Dokdonella sp.]HUD42979.1 GNAT family N-acetyltransferase [Dokdonella sp.]
MSPNTVKLETERLILRPPIAEDFEDFAAFCADADTMRHLGGVQVRPVAWRSFVGVVGSWHVRGYAFFSVIEKATGRWVGRLGPWQPEGWPGTEIGWGIARPYWGRGYAPEAAAAATDWAFGALGWTEVIHTIGADNLRSKAVAAKLGSRYLRQGRLPAPLDLDVEIWGQTREAWRARRTGLPA